MNEQASEAQPTNLKSAATPPQLNPWVLGVPLSLISALVTGILFGKVGIAALAVPALAGAALAFVLRRKAAWLALSHEATIAVLVGIGALSLLGAGSARRSEAQEQDRALVAQQTVALGKTDVAAQRRRLAALDEPMLAALKKVAPALEAEERARRMAEAGRLAGEAERQTGGANSEIIAAVLTREKGMRRDDWEGRAGAYRELHNLAPTRQDFAQMMNQLEAERDKLRLARAHPASNLTLVSYQWYKGGFGTVMTMDAKVRNDSDLTIQDFTIACTLTAPSGTVIDSNTQVVYESIPPHQTKSLRGFNMGFIVNQVAGSSCEITDAKIAE